MGAIKKHIILVGKTLSISVLASSAFASNYNPGAIASMPRDASNFVNRLNQIAYQAQSYSMYPNARSGMSALERYYQSRHDAFLEALDNNLIIIEQANQVIREISRAGGPEGKTISDCLAKDDNWRDFKRAFESTGQLRSFAQTSVSGYASTDDRSPANASLYSNFERMAAGLDMSGPGSFWESVEACCKPLGSERSKYNACNEEKVKQRLANLGQIQKLPSKFVDPLNPGPYTPNLTPEDIITLMSLGQMNDFIEAKDFNAQVTALARLDSRCMQAKDDALEKLKRQGETRSVIQTAVSAFQCGAWNLLRNSSKGLRQLGFGLVNSQITMSNGVSACPDEVKQAAQTALFYSPEAYRADFESLVTLPSTIVQSQPIAKPVEVSHQNGSLVLELKDEAGYVKETLFISDDMNPQYLQALSNSGRSTQGGSSTQQIVTNNPAIGSNNGRVAARTLVNGVGVSQGNDERVLVRGLADKIAQGDLEAARSLAGAVKNRKTELKRGVEKAEGERALLEGRRTDRATEARGIASRSIIQESAAETAKSISKNLLTLREAMGLSSDSGRVVERPGTTNVDANGNTVVSNVAAVSDRDANNAYKVEQAKKTIGVIQSSIKSMTQNIVAVAAKLNNIIQEKAALIAKLPTLVNQVAYRKISDAGFDARDDLIMSKQNEVARVRKEITTLNAQELGLRAAISTAKMSFSSYVNGAAAFQGLMVRRAENRVPASVNPQQMFVNNQQQQVNPFQTPQLNPNLGGASVLPPGMSPPVFNPTSTTPQPTNTGFLMKLLDLPFAHASVLTLAQKQENFLKEFDAYIKSYDEYARRLDSDVIGLKQKAWERFILNEREMRKEPLLSTQERVIVSAFSDALSEEVPQLIELKKSGKLPSGTSSQINDYIEQIRRDSVELREYLIKDTQLSMELEPVNPINDEESWTGILPALALD